MFGRKKNPVVFPANLSQIDAVEIVLVRDLKPDSVDRYLEGADQAPCIKTAPDDAMSIVDIFRQLPSGEQARCHVPTFGLRFLAGEKAICRVSICWRCNNIYGDQEGSPIHFGFDARAGVSQKLLAKLRAISNWNES